MNFKPILKSLVPHVLAVLAMIIVSSVYFYPAWEGKTLQGEDVVGGYGKGREARDFRKYENETVIWNGSIFSGMPEYVHANYKGASTLKKVFNIPMRLGMPREVASIFWYMLGFYILLVAVGVSPLLSAGGAIAFALGSYNIIIILAGHYMKVYTLALIPPTLAGIILIFRGKYRWGFILTSFFLAMQITMAHIQMIYYFFISLLVFGIVELFYQIKEKTLKQFSKTVLVLVVAAILGIAPNYSRLINYYLFNDQSIRGSSELTIGNEGVKTEKGLDKDYINMWSSGVDEAMMVIVPNVKGGSTASIAQDRELLNSIPRQYRQTLGSFNQYWGDQPFSGGPNYLGVVFVFLFVIGVFVIKDRLKTALLIPVILFLLLAMGGNLSFFTDLWIDYFPMYNKFRTPVSILALSAILLSFFALYSAYQISTDDDLLAKKAQVPGLKKEQPVYLVVAAGFVLFLLINIALPHLFNSYISNVEQNQIVQWQSQPNVGNQVDQLINELVAFRIGVFRADLWRALILVVLVTAAIYLLSRKKLSKQLFWGTIIVLAVFDFWGIGRRYVGIDQFHKNSLVEETYALSNNDRQIYLQEMNASPELQEKLSEYTAKFNPKNKEEEEALLTHVINKFTQYRVFNLAGSPFQENVTANAHKSIGGYHPVKLRRYQDMIEQHIGKMHMPVLNMLNAKYFITQNGVQTNPAVMGDAWFVDSVKWVDNPNDEILALNDIDVTNTAVIRTTNKDKLKSIAEGNSINGSITLDDYSPDRMSYTSSSDKNGLAVFSEVYYPDWKAYIDGKEAEIYRVNYVLRGIEIPRGDHKVEFVFHPGHYYNANLFSQYSFYILILVLLGSVLFDGYKRSKTNSSK
ncbi:YfhO family protein [Maribellus sediminis]|uniref:YfhO family protein n=1 Tax=Maribellus sediminis TaxID=2696285 RepID=UPI00143127EC|nr:YfhO family protein [Maribellus sediminis]